MGPTGFSKPLVLFEFLIELFSKKFVRTRDTRLTFLGKSLTKNSFLIKRPMLYQISPLHRNASLSFGIAYHFLFGKERGRLSYRPAPWPGFEPGSEPHRSLFSASAFCLQKGLRQGSMLGRYTTKAS